MKVNLVGKLRVKRGSRKQHFKSNYLSNPIIMYYYS